jgi:hypothetical protein
MTNSTPPEARDWSAGATVIVPATDPVSAAPLPAGGAASMGGCPGGSDESAAGAAPSAGPERSREVSGRSVDAGAASASDGGSGFSRWHDKKAPARRQAPTVRRVWSTRSFYAMAP